MRLRSASARPLQPQKPTWQVGCWRFATPACRSGHERRASDLTRAGARRPEVSCTSAMRAGSERCLRAWLNPEPSDWASVRPPNRGINQGRYVIRDGVANRALSVDPPGGGIHPEQVQQELASAAARFRLNARDT